MLHTRFIAVVTGIYNKWKQPLGIYALLSVVWIYLLALAVFYALVTAYFPTQNGDNIEHIHSSFLVAQGEIPYRDFFQHHHPLLWFLFAPFAWFFRYDTTVAEVACFVSLLFFLKSLVYVYRIGAEFLANRWWGLLAAAVIATPATKLYAIDLRPDNYMIFCLMAGLYWYFTYLKINQTRSLVIAFGWFFLSFMFAQKALFALLVLGLSGLYFWQRKEIKTADLLKALIFPLVGIGCFIGYLCYYDIFKLYFLCNYRFNLQLVEGFEFSKIVKMPLYIQLITVCGWLGVCGSWWRPNRYWGMLVVLFVAEFFQRRFYFSPYSYYYWFMVYLAVLTALPVFYHWGQKLKGLNFLILFMLIYHGITMMTAYYNFAKHESKQPYLPDYITRRLTPCDYVFNGDGMMYNIFGRDPAYYWQLIGQLDIIGEQVGIRAKPDINMLIRQYRPKFIFGRNYFNRFAEENGVKKIVHYVDTELIEQFYEPTPFYPVYQLKAVYDKRLCRQNSAGIWQYQNEIDVK